MRFLFAIGVFAVAAVLLGVGVVQKVFFAGDEYTTLTTTVETNAPYMVIDGKTLTMHGTNPIITVSGSKTTFVGFGRNEDVAAWIGADDYDVLKYSTNKSDFVFGEGKAAVVVPSDVESPALTEKPILTPEGSDLWLGEAAGKNTATLATFLDSDMSAIIAADGKTNAPGNVTIAWPLPSRIPFATGFIIGGGIAALIGLVLYLWACWLTLVSCSIKVNRKALAMKATMRLQSF